MRGKNGRTQRFIYNSVKDLWWSFSASIGCLLFCQKSSTLDVWLVEYVSGPTDLKNQNLPAQTARAEKTSTCYNIL